MNKILPLLIEEFRDKLQHLDNFVAREVTFPELPHKIKVAIGMRRTGKSYLCFDKIKQLLLEDVHLDQILYINFEDDRLQPMTQKTLAAMLDDFYTLYPKNHERQCYFFLDEIQVVEEWALVVRRFFESKKIQIYLSGSSSKLLSKEIATTLRGRSIATEVWPFSFEEYQLACEFDSSPSVKGKKFLDQQKACFLEYLQVGGFPEVVSASPVDRARILQDYVEVVIFRDIIERHHIKNIVLIKYLIKTLLKNVGSRFSVHKFAADLKSQGIVAVKNTVHEYLGYVEDTFLAFTIPVYSESLRQTQSNPRKIYAIDAGLIRSYTMSLSPNWGYLLENLVFLDLRRQGDELYYYLTRQRYEVDFLAKSITGELRLYQVVWDDSDPDTLERELRALRAAEAELGIAGELVTPTRYLEGILKRNPVRPL